MNNQKKKLRFIINPKSGIGKQKKVEAMIGKCLDLEKFDYEICYTLAPQHAVELSREAAEMKYDAVVVVGGDGTINEAARGLLHTQTALGIIPAGSGNGLSHFLKIPLKPSKALKLINRFNIKLIDTGLINNHVFVSIAGIGFDAYVAELFSKSKKRGFWAYIKVIVTQYLIYNPKRFKIYVDGKIMKKNAFMLTFGNSDQFGFNARIASTAVIDDGLIDFCIVRKPRIYYAALCVPFLFLGYMHKTPLVKIFQTKHVKIIQRKNNISHIDGDQIDLGKCIEVSVVPKSLYIIC